MTTLMIRLEYPPPGDQLVIRGFRISHGEQGWHEDVGPVKELPHDLPMMTTATGDRRLDELARSVLLDPAAGAQAPEIGRQLWRVISDGSVGDWWAEQIAAAQGTSVRTILDIRASDLRSLPWELMTSSHGKLVFCDDQNPWVRAIPNWPPVDELAAPVQVLVVVGEHNAENGHDDLKMDAELDAIHRCVRSKPGSWHVQVLTAPTLVELRQTYADFDPHILHVIGHGETTRDGRYALRIKPANGEPWPLTVEQVANLPTPAPRLVVLNCCRTSQAGAVAEPAWSFSDAFLERGSAAVVTMQGDIPSDASIAFTRRFYADLVAGEAIDAAAAHARLHVSDVMLGLQETRSWAMPSLLVAADPDHVLPVKECLSPAQLIKPPFLKTFGSVADYVDRSSERRTVLRVLDSSGVGTRVVIVKGEPKHGRSAVLRSALLTLRMRGRNAVYVDLDQARQDAQGRKLSWLTVLRLVREAIWDWVPEIPVEPRRRFTHELGYLIDHREPEPWTDALPEIDPGQEFPSEGEDHRDWIVKIVVAFRRMLVAASAEHPLLLALDSLSAVHDEDLRDVLAEQLLLPLTTGSSRDGIDADVRCLTAASSRELTIIPDDFRRPLEQIGVEIKPFRRDDIPRLVGEYVARHNLHPTEDWRTWVQGLLVNGGDDALQPGNFSDFLKHFARLIQND